VRAAHYRHYSYWEDARRDYFRYRAISHLIRTGVYLATRPTYSTTVVVTGTTYYYAGGVYYVQQGSGYVVTSAPPGAVVYALPTSTTPVVANNTTYYYYGGTYYVATTAPAAQPQDVTVDSAASGDREAVSDDQESQAEPAVIQSTVTTSDGDEVELPPVAHDEDQNYEVVAAPVGASVPYLPEDAQEQTVNGKKYFVYEGAYYRAFASDDDIIYMVVGDPTEQ
jgi:hypothetical protein